MQSLLLLPFGGFDFSENFLNRPIYQEGTKIGHFFLDENEEFLSVLDELIMASRDCVEDKHIRDKGEA